MNLQRFVRARKLDHLRSSVASMRKRPARQSFVNLVPKLVHQAAGRHRHTGFLWCASHNGHQIRFDCGAPFKVGTSPIPRRRQGQIARRRSCSAASRSDARHTRPSSSGVGVQDSAAERGSIRWKE